MSLITHTQSADIASIKGAGYFHDLRYNGNINVSMAGGSIIKFSASSGLDDNPVANRVTLRNHDIFTTWIDIAGHLMDGKKALLQFYFSHFMQLLAYNL